MWIFSRQVICRGRIAAKQLRYRGAGYFSQLVAYYLSLEEAREQIADYIHYYNDERLHSSLGYIAPKVKLEGREKLIFTERDSKLEAARDARKQKRRQEKLHPAQHWRTPEGETFNPLTQQG